MSAPAEETEKPASPKRKTALDDTLLLNVVTEYFKLAGLALVVWFVGYFAFSPSWLLLGLVVYVWKEKHTREKKLKIEINQRTARDEKNEILARVEDLPSWVSWRKHCIIVSRLTVNSWTGVRFGYLNRGKGILFVHVIMVQPRAVFCPTIKMNGALFITVTGNG